MVAFGTSGLRGLSVDLVAGPAAAHAAAFGEYLLQAGRVRPGETVFLGRDRRESSPALADQCGAALASVGLVAVDCGILPTPALALHAIGRGAASIMVTGSHIPADRNGLKFYRPDGEIDKADELEIASRAAGWTVALPAPSALAGDGGAALAGYRKRYTDVFGKRSLSGLTVGIYEHSSVARDVMADLLSAFGAAIVRIEPSEVFVPIDTEAVDADLRQRMAAWARTHGLDAIVSTDGDGDRPLLTDESGTQVRGDVLGLLTARLLSPRTVVTPVTSNAGIEAAAGADVVRTRVGSPYVLAAMAEAGRAGTVVGFEANGGFIVGSEVMLDGHVLGPLPTRDSLLPLLAVLATRRTDGRPLSAIVAGLELPESASGRLEHVEPARSGAFMAWLRSGPAAVAELTGGLGAVERVSDVDGVQIFLSGGGVLHYRPSGNAPEMRCYAQARDAAAAAELLQQGLERLKVALARV